VRILVVEMTSGRVVATGLKDAGFVVDLVGSAESADTALATEHFDLIVLDLGLPGATGCTSCRRCAAAATNAPGCPCWSDRARWAGRPGRRPRAGADDYLVKLLNCAAGGLPVLIRRTGSMASIRSPS
jgi:DNA-binding response OmpR family regulator